MVALTLFSHSCQKSPAPQEAPSETPGSEKTLGSLHEEYQNQESREASQVEVSRQEAAAVIGGKINELSGSGLVIKFGGAGQEKFVTFDKTQNSAIYFESPVPNDKLENWQIVAQPDSPQQYCEIGQSSAGLDNTQDIVEINCSSQIYTLSGSVSGANGKVVLANKRNPAENSKAIIEPQHQIFLFEGRFSEGEIYSIEVESSPQGQTCYLPNPAGAFQRSDIHNLEVICKETAYIGGAVESGEIQEGGDSGRLHFWLYHDKEHYYNPVYRYSLATLDGPLKEFPFEFPLSAGTYYLRVFRDSDRDSLPTMGSDPQSTAIGPIAAPGPQAATVSVVLQETQHADRYLYTNAYMFHEPRWKPYQGGVCGGLYLKLETGAIGGTAENLSNPMARLPDYGIYYLHDDGGCGDGQGNLNSSYDDSQGDGNYSYGLPAEGLLYAGEYLFFYANIKYDFIHFGRDTIEVLSGLDPLILLENNLGAQASPVLNPEFRWSPVSGAMSYEVEIVSNDGFYSNSGDPWRFTNSLFYYPEGRYTLEDNKSYMARIFAYDTDRTLDDDFDAAARGPEHFFVTDTSGTNSTPISGALENLLNPERGVILYASGNPAAGWEASLFLPPHSDTYQVSVLNDTAAKPVVFAALNVDSTGHIYSHQNYSTSKWIVGESFEAGIPQSINIMWPLTPALAAPPNLTTGAGFSPSFSWAPYSQYAPEKWSQILIVRRGATEAPDFIFGLPSHVTSFDLSNPEEATFPESYDIKKLLLCLNSGGEWNDNINSCSIELPEAPLALGDPEMRSWSLMIVECDFGEHLGRFDGDENGYNDYSDCVMDIILKRALPYAVSQEWVFTP